MIPTISIYPISISRKTTTTPILPMIPTRLVTMIPIPIRPMNPTKITISQFQTYLSFSATSAPARPNATAKQPRSPARMKAKRSSARMLNTPKPANAFSRNSRSKEQEMKKSFLTKTSNLSGSRKFLKAVLTGRALRITADKSTQEVTAGVFRLPKNSFLSLTTADTIPQ